MLTFQRWENTNILEFTLDGGMSREAFDEIAAAIEQIIAEHGKVRLIEIIRNLGAIDPAALWRDLQFAPRHMRDFSHVAVVADQQWIEWLGAMAKPFFPGEVRTFRLDQLEAARDWMRGSAPARE